MSSVVIHFPDGTREFRFPQVPLEVGSVIWHQGERYRVIDVSSDSQERAVVTVEPVPDDIGDVLDSERGGIELVPVD